MCLLPAESDSNSAYSADAVAARRQNGVAVHHTEGVGSRVIAGCASFLESVSCVCGMRVNRAVFDATYATRSLEIHKGTIDKSWNAKFSSR